MVKVVVIAGTHSGVGKTSLSVGLMLALRQQGLTVQPFKVGPDFLDPLHHVAACGRPSINLDGWMLNKKQVLDSFHRHTADADVAVVEGVMGLYDSRDGASDDGSTAQIAKWLGAPVVLVVDCWAMARSAAAVIKGYAEFDPELQMAGVLLNKVGGAAHGVWLAEALSAAWQQQRLQRQVQVLGCIPKDDSVSVPERYLGLCMPHEQDAVQSNTDSDSGNNTNSRSTPAATSPAQQQEQQAAATGMPAYLTKLAQHASKHVDMTLLLQMAADVVPPDQQEAAAAAAEAAAAEAQHQQLQEGHGSQPAVQLVQQAVMDGRAEHALPLTKVPGPSCRIAVAMDDAFCFYYQDNLALLKAAGADLVFFSPLHSAHLPDDTSGIYFGGGYPECHAQQLSSNSSLLTEVRQWAAAGGVVYAECGGLIYLCQGFQPSDTTNSSSASGASRVNGSTRTRCGASLSGSSGSTSSSTSSGMVPLVGLLPFEARMGGMKMGYIEVEVLPGNPLFPAGTHARGQIYHFSEVTPLTPTNSNSTSCCSESATCAAERTTPEGAEQALPAVQTTYRLRLQHPGAQPRLEGYAVGNVLASYVHLHWGGCPVLAAALVDKCCSSSSSSSNRSSTQVQAVEAVQAAGKQVSPKEQLLPEGAAVTTPSSCCCMTGPDPLCSSSSRQSNGTGPDSSSKIVSLLPSGTEVVYALGLQERLVGVSGFCDWPAEARSKACAVRSLIDVDSMTSDEIEVAMQSFKASGQSPFEIDVSLLARERPGLILTQDACGTCDADCSLVCKAMQQAGLSTDTTQLLVLHPKTLAEVLDSIITIGTAAGVADRAHQLVEPLQARLQAVAAAVQAYCPGAAASTVGQQLSAAVAEKAAAAGSSQPLSGEPSHGQSLVANVSTGTGSPPKQPLRQGLTAAAARNGLGGCSHCSCQEVQAPRVLSLEGLNPLVLGGQWLPDVKLAAGAVDASGQQPGDAPARITWEQVLAFAPDVLILCPCSRSPVAAMPDVTRLTERPGFRDLPAVTAGSVYIIDHSYFSRPGPRLVDGVELLHALIWRKAAGHLSADAAFESWLDARSKISSSSGKQPSVCPTHQHAPGECHCIEANGDGETVGSGADMAWPRGMPGHEVVVTQLMLGWDGVVQYYSL